MYTAWVHLFALRAYFMVIPRPRKHSFSRRVYTSCKTRTSECECTQYDKPFFLFVVHEFCSIMQLCESGRTFACNCICWNTGVRFGSYLQEQSCASIQLYMQLICIHWYVREYVIHIEWCHEYLGYPSRGRSPREGYPNMGDIILYVLYIMAANQFCLFWIQNNSHMTANEECHVYVLTFPTKKLFLTWRSDILQYC